MDFAPYQSSPPEHSRVASPERGASPRASLDASRRAFSPPTQRGTAQSPPPLQHPQPQRLWANLDGQQSDWRADERAAYAAQSTSTMPGSYPMAEVSEFDTSLGIRLDYEASFAYLAMPPIGAIFLLIVERNSDFVRFHAWQSALLFTAILMFHLFISWSSVLSWLFFIADVVLMAFLAYKAFSDAEILDRYEVPFFGRLASRILDDE